MNRSDLRPWCRWLPSPAITVLFWVLFPVYIALGAAVGCRDGFRGWRYEIQQWRHIRKQESGQ